MVPDFADVDNRLLSLQLVKQGMTDAVIFSPDGRNRQAADVLYKKNILAIRGSFRPVTKVNIDMIAKGLAQFKQGPKSTLTTCKCCSRSRLTTSVLKATSTSKTSSTAPTCFAASAKPC